MARMRGYAAALLAFLPLGAAAEVVVHLEADGRVSVRADAPASEVLDRLAAQTGMKVVYEGAAPRARVLVAFERRTAAEAVLMVLEGLGLDHVMRLDATGTRPEMLMLSASTPSSRPLPAPTHAIPAMRPAPEVVEEDNVEAEEEEPPIDEGVEAGGARRPPVPAQPGRPGPSPQPTTQAPVNRPAFAPPNYPVSPFAPLAPAPPTVVTSPSPTPAPEMPGDPDQ